MWDPATGAQPTHLNAKAVAKLVKKSKVRGEARAEVMGKKKWADVCPFGRWLSHLTRSASGLCLRLCRWTLRTGGLTLSSHQMAACRWLPASAGGFLMVVRVHAGAGRGEVQRHCCWASPSASLALAACDLQACGPRGHGAGCGGGGPRPPAAQFPQGEPGQWDAGLAAWCKGPLHCTAHGPRALVARAPM